MPYEQQQFHALMAENGVLMVDDVAQAALAQRIRGLAQPGRAGR
ncbi:hypothetical protein [Micromonospora sp. WMMD710]|nr:hypothetical protein [Micromonospora sp. WMMD710]MDG4762106.1 hypothetical protein [Micromonospora sp. WMMD710]